VDLNATENPTSSTKNEIQKQDKVTSKNHEANKKTRNKSRNTAEHKTKVNFQTPKHATQRLEQKQQASLPSGAQPFPNNPRR